MIKCLGDQKRGGNSTAVINWLGRKGFSILTRYIDVRTDFSA